MLTDEQMLDRMRNGWRGGLPETSCGVGSTMSNTANVRTWLPDVCSRYRIRSVNDAGGGDMHWVKTVDWDVTYRAFDLVARVQGVAPFDITRFTLPYADAILCRHTLNHIFERVQQTLALFRKSGARYLLATQFDHQQIDHREFSRLDLREYLGDPFESVEDGGADGCRLAIWAL